jgi:hypothetical protein
MNREQGPSVAGSVVLTLFAAFLSYLAVFFIAAANGDNVPGEIILAVVLVGLACWVDRLAFQRWREIAASWTRSGSDSPS